MLLFLLISIISCKEKSNPVISDVDFNYFYKSWTNSFEERIENDSVYIYRPSDYKNFPTSWYREKLIFNPDHTCSYLVIGDRDLHHFENGKWCLVDQEKNIVTIIGSKNTIYRKFRITKLKQDILKYIIAK